MTAQDTILRACAHAPQSCEVNMGKGEIIRACSECWNQSVYARRAERKRELAAHWNEYRTRQTEAMREAGATFGQRVSYFCRSMLGFGGVLVTGTIVANRNGIAVVRLDRIVDGHKQTEWTKAWRPMDTSRNEPDSVRDASETVSA